MCDGSPRPGARLRALSRPHAHAIESESATRSRNRIQGEEMRRTTALGWTALLTILGACGGGGDLLLPGSAEPAKVTLVQGDQQNGRVGEALPQPLIAQVTDANDRPIDGATVVF